MPEFTGPLANAFGTYYPLGYVVAVIHDPSQAARAGEALRDAGVADEDVRLLSGQEVVELGRAFREQRSVIQRLEAFLPSDERVNQQEYLEEAGKGHSILTVHASGPDQVERARRVLAAHQAHAMRHYGPSVITDLDPAPPP